MARPLSTLTANQGILFEGMRWRDDRWWVSDIFGRRVSTVTPDGVVKTLLDVAERPSGLGFLPDGSLLIVSQENYSLLRRAGDGTVTVHADLRGVTGPERGLINDMVVDGAGRAWIGEFGFDIDRPDPRFALGHVYCVHTDGTAVVAADDSYFPNGMVVTADGSTLIVGETFGARYSAYEIGSDGTLGERRTWAALGALPAIGPVREMRASRQFSPDGCCLDADGHLWAADPANARIALVEEGGRILEQIQAPDGFTFIACMLGGADGRTLLISAVPAGRDFTERRGVLFTTVVDVPHGGLP